MEFDLELQEKDLLKELIWDGEVEQIAIWMDGEWSIVSSSHFQMRNREEKPVYILNLREVFSEIDFSQDTVERHIMEIEQILNGRKIQEDE
ncbi:hypothetical protein [Peribacillus tepidiphilus]|jgi:hypothetical protein|uniref:hypothetical protein n=1 Tax=Peribacillus tepidiphilus TaxID=2652445 RepID=UPI0012910674|nr:hypothetical protein [Peribacillus tepidiphilus]